MAARPQARARTNTRDRDTMIRDAHDDDGQEEEVRLILKILAWQFDEDPTEVHSFFNLDLEQLARHLPACRLGPPTPSYPPHAAPGATRARERPRRDRQPHAADARDARAFRARALSQT